MSLEAAAASALGDPLSEGERAFVTNWGMLAEAFGMKRDQGRVHALIYIATEPLDDAAIAERIGIAEADAARHLTELVKWGVVQVARTPSSVRYSTHPDPWVWFLQIVAERHHQEFGPVVSAMRSTLAMLTALGDSDPAVLDLRGRAQRFTTFVEDLSRLIELFLRLGSKPMAVVLRTLAKIVPRG